MNAYGNHLYIQMRMHKKEKKFIYFFKKKTDSLER